MPAAARVAALSHDHQTRLDRTVSKESRRAARLARESRRAGTAGRTTAGSGGAAAGAAGPAESGTAGAGAGTGSGSGVRRPSHGPSGAPRAGRRERVRPYQQPSFFERYRTLIISVAAIAVVAVAIGWVFLGSTAAAWTCGNQFNPSPTPTITPGSSTRLGFVQDDMGRNHQAAPPFSYLYCPPASGPHYNQPGTLGPITPRVYKPDDKVGPPNWIHNLEHGAIVVLYRTDGPGATSAGQAAFKTFFDAFPPSQLCQVPPRVLSPVIAPFNDMPHPFAALVWGRVLYLDTWDPDLVLKFYNTEAERLDSNGDLVAPPEDVTGCAARLKSAQPSAGASGASSGSPAASAASAAPSAPPSVAPEASPSPS
jgi:hypothetical protein